MVFVFPSLVFGKDPYARNPAVDVRHYTFQLEVNDSTNIISGRAWVEIRFRNPVVDFELDLAGKNAQGQGMEVLSVTLKGAALRYSQENEKLKIVPGKAVREGEQLTFEIIYRGIPRDGLIIGNTKFGDRGFFGDNWPNRGHQWLPVIDHPSDKASVDFVIIAPLHYGVVANGVKTEESLLDKKRKLTRYHEAAPIPVKVMVVGIARFAVQYAGKVDDISVESWVYPQNKEDGFHDYAVAVKVLDYFHRHIAPYPFRKLANVQSKTKFGGLENAGAIFYFENSVTGKGERESLIAHEEAHQWFGDSASEADWHHVWLSEGFATYFASLYLEFAYGHDRLVAEQMQDRDQVIKFYSRNQAPVVDTTITDINKVLNTNTYQKAGWVLHMLRHELGDPIFWKGIQQYYNTYQYSNALTQDFQRIMEEVSGKDLKKFFDQWIYRGGHPQLRGTWQFDGNSKTIALEIEQTQKELFSVPVEVGIAYGDGRKDVKTVMLNVKTQKFTLPAEAGPVEVSLDPGTWLLFEGGIVKK